MAGAAEALCEPRPPRERLRRAGAYVTGTNATDADVRHEISGAIDYGVRYGFSGVMKECPPREEIHTVTQARDDLACYNAAMRMTLPAVVTELRGILGAKLVAYIGAVSETRAVRQWAEGERVPSQATGNRLRLAYQAAKCISDVEGPETAQAWFQGLNPLLDDVSPARLLREGEVETDGRAIITAERFFLANG